MMWLIILFSDKENLSPCSPSLCRKSSRPTQQDDICSFPVPKQTKSARMWAPDHGRGPPPGAWVPLPQHLSCAQGWTVLPGGWPWGGRCQPASLSLTTSTLFSAWGQHPRWLAICFLGSVSLCFSVYLFPCLSFLWYLALEIQSSFMVLGLLDSSWTDHKQSDGGNSVCLMSSFNICNRL